MNVSALIVSTATLVVSFLGYRSAKRNALQAEANAAIAEAAADRAEATLSTIQERRATRIE